MYSDGLATVSVFVEAQQVEVQGAGVASDAALSSPAEPPMQGLARVGSGFAFSTVVQGHQVTAVGEVPAETVEYHRALGQILQRRRNPAPLTCMRFLLYSRPGCGLCEEMLLELAALPAAAQAGVDVLDVDADPAAKVRYGHKIPVLLYAGELVCHGRLDPEEVHKALAYHRRPV